MPRHPKKRIDARPYLNYSPEQLNLAVEAVKKGASLRQAAELFVVKKDTLRRRVNSPIHSKPGRRPIFTAENEEVIATCLAMAGQWGFPLTVLDVRLIVKSYLDKQGKVEKRFKDNLPGYEWTRSFLERQRQDLTERLVQNVKRSRGNVDSAIINEYFDNLEKSLQNVRPELIINYDETNLTDDPKRTKVIVRRKTRHPERIMDTSKSSVSVMFAVTGGSKLLPPYIVYKSEHLYDSWTAGGPKGTIYNRSKSGWFTLQIFEDWFRTIVVPYFKKMDPELPKAMIGDNLASHISEYVIGECQKYNIRFILLPPNSTGLTQPLDAAFFKPLKVQWSQCLEEWKKKNRGTVSKVTFPALLKRCLEGLSEKSAKNIEAGFRGTGIIPIDRQQVLKRLPPEPSVPSNCEEMERSWTESFQEYLSSMREKECKPLRIRRKKIQVQPGASVVNAEEKETSDSVNSAVMSLHDSDGDSKFVSSASSSDEEENFPVRPIIQTLKKGDFVLIQLTYDEGTSREKARNFVGEVQDVGPNVNVSCLRQSSKNFQIFNFPIVRDYIDVTPKQIMKVLVPSSTRRGYTFPTIKYALS